MYGTENFSVTYPKPISAIGESPQLSSYAEMASRFARVRSGLGGQTERSYISNTAVPSPFVPSPLGGKRALLEPRKLEGMGEFVLDPMQNFKPEKLDLEGYKYGGVHMPVAPNKTTGASIRRKGISAYKRQQAGKNPHQPPKQRKKAY